MNMFLYLGVINALTFATYWLDKRAAKQPGARRIPEATLLLQGFLGGTPAALVAQRLLRHKNRKRAFQFKFWAITFVQLALLLMPPPVVQRLLQAAFY